MRTRPLSTVLLAAAAAVVVTGLPAQAATGSLTDPRGDYPDIVKLAWNNGASTVKVTMTYADIADAQNQSFYLRWGTAGHSYQVFVTSGYRALRYDGTDVRCAGLGVTSRADLDRTTVTVPRSCLPKAPGSLRFQGIATQGVGLVDETRVSPLTPRG